MTSEGISLNAALRNLKGHRMSAVTFVEDYIQLHFEQAVLTAYTLPSITLADDRIEEHPIGYKEALRAFEGTELQDVSLQSGEEAVMTFSGGSLSISLRDEDYQGPEALQFIDEEGSVWMI